MINSSGAPNEAGPFGLVTELGSGSDPLSSLGVLALQVDAYGSIVLLNEAAAKLAGQPARELEGIHHETVFGSLLVATESVIERPFLQPDGTTHRIKWSVSPEFDLSGKFEGLSALGIATPISLSAFAGENPPVGNRTPSRRMQIGQDGTIAMAAPELRTPDSGIQQAAVNAPDPTSLDESAAEMSPHPEDLPFGEVDSEVSAGLKKSRYDSFIRGMRELSRIAAFASPLEIGRTMLPVLASIAGASAGAIVIPDRGEQRIESFGLPLETAGTIAEILPLAQAEPARLKALTRMHVVAALPLRGTVDRLGDVILFSRGDYILCGDQWEMIETISRAIASAIEFGQMRREAAGARHERERAYEETLQAMVAALDLRDHETEGHTQRVTRMSRILGERLGLGRDELRSLEHGALLHDVGKIGVPDGILHKPGPLNDSEWEIMRLHPQYAHDILAPIPHLAHAIDVPYCHHERFDGSGYPRRMRGEDIPLVARIFAVIDVFDAMTSARPYRPALAPEYAIAHIRAHAGTHFDPAIAEEFVRMVESLT